MQVNIDGSIVEYRTQVHTEPGSLYLILRPIYSHGALGIYSEDVQNGTTKVPTLAQSLYINIRVVHLPKILV